MGRLLAPVVAGIALLAGCGQPEQPSSRYDIDANAQGEPEMETHCYLQVAQGAPRIEGRDTIPGPVDSLYIRLDILGELANGVYNWLPEEKDHMIGSFQGSIDGDEVTAVYTYTAEGATGKQEVLFKVEDGQLRVATGEMETSEGVILFKDKSQVTYGEPIPKVDCK
ncbi:MAG: hypothetical protein IPL81_05430 [Flavobacteriales bacterium]|jgi:hypothetical protein|nr:hypothetical protein [Flavobacteriales bacterium]MBK7248461.1 hypothetical protein [Flavobacteriales bacterium]MBK7288553.1 hypothetical protein [Flavobacteriales bacterium]MBK9059320.1 hypothetical protein [Flavobacteriales bacterium]QQS73712.1 MAG: hypothetical protein IPP95_05695 [Flavobacteriales bacterium]